MRDIVSIIHGGRESEQVEIDPVLKAALVGANGDRRLCHPACCEPYLESDNCYFNSRLKEWSARRDKARAIGDWQAFVDSSEERFRVDALLEIKGDVHAPEWAQLARRTWIFANHPRDGRSKWREVFSAPSELPGFMTSEETQYLAGLPDLVTVYRGCRDSAIDGLSWTTKRTSAEYFEYKVLPRHVAMIIEGKVRRADIFAFVDKNEEFEILVYPEYVKARRVLKQSGEWIRAHQTS